MAVVGYIDGYVDENNNEHGLTDTVAQGLITAIKDGSSIDSFGDVETALADKPSRANVIANTQLIADTVGWSGKNFNKSDADHVFVKGTARTYNFKFGKDVVQGNKYTVSFDVSNISGYTGNNAIGVRFIEDAVSSDDWYVLKTATGRVSHTFTARSDCEVGENKSCVYMYIPNSEGNDATITISNLMFTDADVLDQTYEPYFGSTAFPRSEQRMLGAKNLLPNNASNKTDGNVAWVVNADKSITINTSAAASSVQTLQIGEVTGLQGNYILNGVTGGSTSTYGIQLYDVTTSTWITQYAVDGDSTINLADKTHTYRFVAYVRQGVEVSNKIIYPMLRLATDPDGTYVPHAMTNRELTLKPITITPATGAVVTNNVSVKNGVVTKIIVAISKDGDAVFFEPSASIGSTVTIGSVPENCKPSIPITGANTNGNWLYVWFIRTNGEISVRIFNKDSYGLKDISINAVY